MSASRVAQRYAKALVEVLDEAKALDQVDVLVSFCDQVKGNSELKALFANVTVASQVKAKIVAELSQKLNLSETLTRFFGVLAEAGRLGILQEIKDAVLQIRDERTRVRPVTLTTAATPQDGEVEAFSAEMEKVLGCNIRVHLKTDPSILGGAVARVGSVVYDGSLSGQLDRLRRQLVKENG